MRQFNAPKTSLGDLDAETAAAVIAASADIALVVDGEGVVRDLAVAGDDLSERAADRWLGQPWSKTVTVESRPKIEQLLRDARAKAPPRWRQVNHPDERGADLPVLYSAVSAGPEGRIIAFGRDLRPVAELQQKLVAAQESMERDYQRLRGAETRYRLLFQIASEAVLIVDAGSMKVVEANPAATRLLGNGSRKIAGRSLAACFEDSAASALDLLLAKVRTAGQAEEVALPLAGGGRSCLVSASLFRQEGSAHFLVRLTGQDGAKGPSLSPARSRLLEVIEESPDALVVTGLDGRILSANRAFVDLAQLASAEQARGETLDRWLGRPGVDMSVLLANLRERGSLSLFATSLRGELGAATPIEISAVSVPHGETPCLGFMIRNVGRRLTADSRVDGELPRSVKELTELVGRVSLRDIVRETTDVIERLCIEAALDLTGDNRASAAEMLGLSRQSLYVKLRRYGLGDLAQEPEK